MKYFVLHLTTAFLFVTIISFLSLSNPEGLKPSVIIPITLVFALITILLPNIQSRKNEKQRVK